MKSMCELGSSAFSRKCEFRANLRDASPQAYHGRLFPNNLTENNDGLAATIDNTLLGGLQTLARGGMGTGPTVRTFCRLELHRRGGRHHLPVRRRVGAEAPDQGHPRSCPALLARLASPITWLRGLRAAHQPDCGLFPAAAGAFLQDGRRGFHGGVGPTPCR